MKDNSAKFPVGPVGSSTVDNCMQNQSPGTQAPSGTAASCQLKRYKVGAKTVLPVSWDEYLLLIL